MTLYWTKTSRSRFLEIKGYINKRFGHSSSLKFEDKVFSFLELLQKYPEPGSLEVPEKRIYGFRLSRQTKVFYRINKDHITLLTFFDTRQDPVKRPE